MKLSTNINLLRLKAAVLNVGGEACVVLPIKQNDLYVSCDEAGKPKGVFLDLVHWENREPGKYGDTHYVKQSHTKDWNKAHTDEDRNKEPIIGNTHPLSEPTLQTEALPKAEVTEQVDWNNMGGLPFPPPAQ